MPEPWLGREAPKPRDMAPSAFSERGPEGVGPCRESGLRLRAGRSVQHNQSPSPPGRGSDPAFPGPEPRGPGRPLESAPRGAGGGRPERDGGCRRCVGGPPRPPSAPRQVPRWAGRCLRRCSLVREGRAEPRGARRQTGAGLAALRERGSGYARWARTLLAASECWRLTPVLGRGGPQAAGGFLAQATGASPRLLVPPILNPPGSRHPFRGPLRSVLAGSTLEWHSERHVPPFTAPPCLLLVGPVQGVCPSRPQGPGCPRSGTELTPGRAHTKCRPGCAFARVASARHVLLREVSQGGCAGDNSSGPCERWRSGVSSDVLGMG